MLIARILELHKYSLNFGLTLGALYIPCLKKRGVEFLQ